MVFALPNLRSGGMWPWYPLIHPLPVLLSRKGVVWTWASSYHFQKKGGKVAMTSALPPETVATFPSSLRRGNQKEARSMAFFCVISRRWMR